MTSKKHPSGAPWRNFYGRFKGKGLRDAQEAYLNEDLTALSPGPVKWDDNPDRIPLDLKERFGAREMWLEIGFGGGEHLAGLALARPDAGFIGAEPFVNGVATMLRHINEQDLKNVRLWDDDVRQVLPKLPAGCLAGAYVMFPDPWPKRRQ